MLSHPLIDAVFNIDSCDPSKQLISVRERLTTSGDRPSILFVLPPAEDIQREIDPDLLFRDNYLLSHIFDISDLQGNDVVSLNGSEWLAKISRNEVSPSDGFPNSGANPATIVNRLIWSPGLNHLAFNATFLVLKIDRLLLTRESVRRFSWFGMGKSTPRPVPATPIETEVTRLESSSIIPVTRLDENPKFYHRPQNPARELGRTASQREHSMAKVDYCLACLQGDVISSTELARRFHDAVGNVIKSLSEAGGTLITEDMLEGDGNGERELAGTEFTLASVYKYAEYRLSRQLLGKLDELLEAEREVKSFRELYDHLKFLDIGQVDIPGLAEADISAFERAVIEASLVLDRLAQARNAHDMCQIFLEALKTLADPKLGTVSADTLLGLFMLTVLRTSEDCAKVFERNLHFVLHFSFQTSDSPAARASAGRLSYTLMVVESVLMQLRMEYDRLAKLANANKTVWESVRGDDRATLQRVAAESPSSMLSRRRGKSILFMATEDENISLLKFLLETFGELFTADFVMRDKDLEGRTLVMKAAEKNATLTNEVVDYLTNSEGVSDKVKQYLREKDLNGRGLAFFLHDPSMLSDEIIPSLDYTSQDKNQMTPIVFHALQNNLKPFLPVIQNFFDHIDKYDNSLLHLSAEDTSLVQSLIELRSCDVNWSNRNGKVALQRAQKQPDVIDVLLRNGGDPWLPFFANDFDFLWKMIRSVRPYPFVVRDVETNKFIIFSESSEQDQERTTVRNIRHSYTCFEKLRNDLVEEYKTSWVPPLPVIRLDYSESTVLFSMFSHILKSEEDVKLSIWLNLMTNHATIRDSPLLDRFLNDPSSHAVESDEAVKGTDLTVTTSPSLEKDDSAEILSPSHLVSILAFLNLAQEQLRSICAALGELIRFMAQVEDIELSASLETTRMERRLSMGLAPLLNTDFRVARCEVTNHLQGSQLPRIVRLSFGQLIDQAESLELRLQDPAKFAEELDKERDEYQSNREKLRQLAEARSKPLWLASSENRRVAEINDLEKRVSSGRREIKHLERLIVNSHYSLASELSSFNKFHEDELLGLIKNYSRNQLQTATDGLKRLEFGYKVSPKRATK